MAETAERTHSAVTNRARRVVAASLAVLVAVLSLLSVVSSYVRGVLLDTDNYVEIIAPLARNPAVQAEVVDAVTARVVDSVRLEGLTADAIELLRARDGRLADVLNSDRRLAEALRSLLSGLGPLLQNQIEEATRRAAERVVESPRFAELWIESNRLAHRATLAALRDQSAVVRTGDGAVRIDVGVVVEEVKRRLVESGFALADRIPTTDSEIVLVESAELARAQRALLLFDQLAPWLPWVNLALALAAVLVAPVRRRGLLWVASGVGVAMIILAVTLAVGRRWLLDRVAATSVDPAAADVIFGAFLSPLWSRVWLVLVLAVLIVVGAILAGPIGARLWSRTKALRKRSSAEVP